MKRWMTLLSMLVLLAALCPKLVWAEAGEINSAAYDQQIAGQDLVGVWQVAPVLGSGWAQRLVFFKGGRFVIGYSQMDGLDRRIKSEGKWELKDGNLSVTLMSHTYLDGGTSVQESEGFWIEGGETKTIPFDPPGELSFAPAALKMHVDENDPESVALYGEGSGRPAMDFDGWHYWKMQDDTTGAEVD